MLNKLIAVLQSRMLVMSILNLFAHKQQNTTVVWVLFSIPDDKSRPEMPQL